ncbi:hypothetical protein OPQ81_008370 [Rhizoctonia solani]|nr:hypothetical protein OPQ81_008370 [Rhizoctonia solani]
MARRGQPDVELAEQNYIECWDQFQTWASRHTSKILRFDPPSNLEDEDEEEPDESFFYAGFQNATVREAQRELRASYYDPLGIDLEDELLEPTRAPISTHWLNTFTTNPIPQYSSFSHIRQHNLIRGDIWTQTVTGERIRLASIDDEEVEGDEGNEDGDENKKKDNRGKSKKEDKEKEPTVKVKEGLMEVVDARKHVRSRTLVNLDVDDHLATNQESMQFVPPEMKRRSMRETLISYEGSFIDIEAWQHFGASWDNDEDIIGAETVRRLLYIHEMSEERINRTKVIPQDIRKLYNFLRHRTYPDLDTIFPRNPPLPRLRLDEWSRKDGQATLESRIREKAFNICCKINCQGIMCPTHYAARERALTEQEAHETNEAQEEDPIIRRGRGPQTPRWETPKLSAHKLFVKFKREKRMRCGEDCFYAFPLGAPEQADSSIDVIESDSEPDARTQADIETIWKVDPDAIPCDVAELSWDKVTCRQAYNIRNRLYINLSEPEPDEDNPGIEERRGGHGGGQVKRKIYPALEECDHPGPCLNSPYCPCNTENRHCIRGCKCDANCKHRRTGCGSANASGTDWSVIRMCVKDARLEVRSDRVKSILMVLIGAYVDGAPCMNVAILMKQWKPTIVKPSQYGNGLFLAGSAVVNDLISDYTGDVCLPRTSCRRSLIATATRRNYLFDIPNYSRLSIDAGYTGNESRFANHPSNGHANCVAKYMWVGNEKHIALYAIGHIWNDSELFLNYGSKFWNSERPGGTDSSREQVLGESSSEVDVYEDEGAEEDVEEEGEEGTSETSVDL